MTDSNIWLANDLVPIEEAFAIIGADVWPHGKNYCPWGEVTHYDGGQEKALRVYADSNSAWCFDENRRFRPVDVLMREFDIDAETAALRLLEHIGYVAPDYESRWDAIAEAEEVVDANALTEALRLACKRMTNDWDNKQFDDIIARKFQQCLSLLSKVKTSADSDQWLAVTKQAMKTVLTMT